MIKLLISVVDPSHFKDSISNVERNYSSVQIQFLNIQIYGAFPNCFILIFVNI